MRGDVSHVVMRCPPKPAGWWGNQCVEPKLSALQSKRGLPATYGLDPTGRWGFGLGISQFDHKGVPHGAWELITFGVDLK